jgi:diguanylate cyclase (GGDEF)-like protein
MDNSLCPLVPQDLAGGLMLSLNKIGKFLDIHALSGRYLIATLLLAVIVTVSAAWVGWVLNKATTASTRDLEARNSIQQLSGGIRDSVWEANYALQAFMISPSDETQQKVLRSIRDAQEFAVEFSTMSTASFGAGHDSVTVLQHDFRELYSQLERLMEIRRNPNMLHPAMALMSDTLLPTNQAFLTALDLAMVEIPVELDSAATALEYRSLVKLQDHWREMINAFRVMVANRFGAFADPESGIAAQAHNVDLFYQQVQADLVDLSLLDQQQAIGFQTSISLETMLVQAESWYRNFIKVKNMYKSDDWRMDLPFLRDVVQPLFAAVWESLTVIETAVEHTSNQQVAELGSAGSRMGIALWTLAGLLFGLLLFGYTVLNRTVLAPIARVAHALSSGVDQSEEVKLLEVRTLEIQQLVVAFEKMRTKVRQRQLALEHQSLHDSLTELPNRAYLQENLITSIHKAQQEGSAVGLMIMDLDHFKEINDTLGHPVGDRILQAVSKRLEQIISASDTVARLGGDEFAVVLPSATHERCEEVASDIIKTLEQVFEVTGQKLYVGVSIGIAIYPGDGTEVSVLMRHADVAMYLAKHTGKGFAFYDDSQDENTVTRLNLVKDLRDAITDDQLELYYQPKMDLGSGRVTGVEALLRWKHPEYGMVPPDRTIPIAERTGLIKALTSWVLRTALHQLAQWRAAGIDLNIAINLSAYDLQDHTLPGVIKVAVGAAKVPPESLTLEITEGAMMSDLTSAMSNVWQIQDMGVNIAIDDFGTGFSSLAYLKKLPVRELKIDKSFVLNMNSDENDAMIVHSTIDLAHNLGLRVVAEGVENKESMEELSSQGCDFIQGYYLCRPLPPQQLYDWLKQHGQLQFDEQQPSANPDDKQDELDDKWIQNQGAS